PPPRSMQALVAVLAEAVEALPANDRALVAFGREWGRSWAARRKRDRGGTPRSRRGRADLLSAELREWGWRPEVIRDNGELRLFTERCLWRDLVPASTGRCCSLEEGLLQGMTEGLLNGHARVVRADGCRLEVSL
ncbi:MAG TPA: hypothetical protein VE737_06750, partial [Actinomycetota bacterium]|nr:hypothetical protein [Actinomycetota bacterium]